MNTLGLYIHVPFCVEKCRYCSFYSVVWNKQQSEFYVDAVIRNLHYYSDHSRNVKTVYFGGGTPSLLTTKQFANIISAISNNFNLTNNSEITIEANPNTLTLNKLYGLHNIGVNRLSIGIQSMNDNELKFLGRLHNAARAEKVILEAEKAKFENISCDLIIALPNQSSDSLAYSINRLISLPIQHVSAYILEVKDGTPFDCNEIRCLLPDEDKIATLYLNMVELLNKSGFAQYEVSNFARPEFESRHNCRYWNCEDYIGIGPSAHSCNNGQRFAVESNIQSFITSDTQNVYVIDDSPCGFEEFAMLQLRLTEGLHLSDIEEKHHYDIIRKIQCIKKTGYIQFDGKTISLTPTGFLISNSIIEYLIF